MRWENEDKLAAIEREIRLRQRVYPIRINSGRMSAEFARMQIELMEQIAEDYRKLVEKERLL